MHLFSYQALHSPCYDSDATHVCREYVCGVVVAHRDAIVEQVGQPDLRGAVSECLAHGAVCIGMPLLAFHFDAGCGTGARAGHLLKYSKGDRHFVYAHHWVVYRIVEREETAVVNE